MNQTAGALRLCVCVCVCVRALVRVCVCVCKQYCATTKGGYETERRDIYIYIYIYLYIHNVCVCATKALTVFTSPVRTIDIALAQQYRDLSLMLLRQDEVACDSVEFVVSLYLRETNTLLA